MHTHSRRLLAVGLAAALALGSTIINPIAVNAKDKDSNAQITVPIGAAVSGINPATGQALSAGRFEGTATITSFAAEGSKLVARGTIAGIVTDGGSVVRSVVSNFSVPVTVPTGSTSTAAASTAAAAAITPQAVCGILNLQLGPIHLDLLGLVLDTNQIVVTLNAVSGAGNLLGNLLCSVAGLLDGGIGGALNQIVGLLNQILAAL
jgi:hypothetical protein